VAIDYIKFKKMFDPEPVNMFSTISKNLKLSKYKNKKIENSEHEEQKAVCKYLDIKKRL